jgi:DNA-binding response OmpR family regulator
MIAAQENQDLDTARVLVIDDDPAVLRMLRLAMSSAEMEVVTAIGGQAALDSLGPGYDAIVLDLQMPVIDGRTFYREMRALGYDIPVIILSAYGAETARRELGAEAALGKPFDPDVLLDTVRDVARHPDGAPQRRN